MRIIQGVVQSYQLSTGILELIIKIRSKDFNKFVMLWLSICRSFSFKFSNETRRIKAYLLCCHQPTS